MGEKNPYAYIVISYKTRGYIMLETGRYGTITKSSRDHQYEMRTYVQK